MHRARNSRIAFRCIVAILTCVGLPGIAASQSASVTDPPGFHLLLRPEGKTNYKLGDPINLEVSCYSNLPERYSSPCVQDTDSWLRDADFPLAIRFGRAVVSTIEKPFRKLRARSLCSAPGQSSPFSTPLKRADDATVTPLTHRPMNLRSIRAATGPFRVAAGQISSPYELRSVEKASSFCERKSARRSTSEASIC
jgi:hypothetical protein